MEEAPIEPVIPEPVIPISEPMSNEKKIIIGLLVLIAAGVIYGVAHNDNRSKALAIVAAMQNSIAVNSPAPVTQNSDPMTDKSFHLETATFTNASNFGEASARITNVSDQVKSAIFAITAFESDGATIAQTLVGSAQSVQPGQTVTVQFIGAGNIPTGQFSYAFQVTAEY